FTLTPLLASRFGKVEHLSSVNWWSHFNLQIEKFLFFLKHEYGKILHWSLFHKRWVVAVVMVLLAGSIALIPGGFIGQEFITQGDRGELLIKLEMSPQTPVYQTNLAAQR